MRPLYIVLACAILCSKIFGQTFVIDDTKEVGAPISELPKSVTATDGKVTLVSDFGGAMRGPISVYLINQSDQDVILNAQDGDVYLKLESKTKDGNWVRAQPHEFSWCGNSYFVSPLIKKGHFYKIDGYQPKNGEKALVRYRLYLQKGLDLVTSEANGFALESDILLASIDEMAIRTGSLDFIESIALADPRITKDRNPKKDMQVYAILELGSGRFTREQIAPILDRVDEKYPDRKIQVEYVHERLKIVHN